MFGVCLVWNADVDIVYCDAAQRKSTIRFMWDFDNILTAERSQREKERERRQSRQVDVAFCEAKR